MADRDVNLVIRAKNEASQALASVAEALKLITESQKEVGDSAGHADSLIARLGAEFAALKAHVVGLEALGTIAANLDKAGAGARKVVDDFKAAAVALNDLKTAQQNAAATTERLKADQLAAVAALRAHKEGIDRAKEAQKLADAEMINAIRLFKEYQALAGRTPLELQSSKGLAQERQTALAAIEAAKASRQNANESLKAEQAAVKSTEQSIKDLNKAITAAGSEERKFVAQVNDATASLEKQKGRLTEVDANFRDIRRDAATAGTALGGVAVSQEKVALAAQHAAVELKKVEDALRRQLELDKGRPVQGPTINPVQAKAAVVAAGGDATAQSTAVLNAHIGALQVAKNVMEQDAAAAARLAAALASADVPTKEMTRDLLLAKAAAESSRAEYERLAAATRLVQTAHTQVVATARALAEGEAQIATQAGRAAAGERSAAVAGLELAAANRAAGGATNELYGLFGRVRTQTLSLIAAYIGLQAAIQGFGKIIDTFKSIEAVSSRLGVVFGQNAVAIKQELAFINEEAARLGISFQTLGDEYSKLSVAAHASNISQDTTRKLFVAVAEAARVNKLSVEDTSGIFLAFTQMMSKGKIQSEEVVKQLGNRVPGALQIMADALGLTTSAMLDLMKKGQLLATDDFFDKVAKQFEKTFGPQLATSLKTMTTAIGQFQVEIFNAFSRVGEGGFIESFTNGLRKLTDAFKSREGRDFFLAIGEALGGMIRVLGVVLPLMAQFHTIIITLIALRFGGVVQGIGLAFGVLAARVGALVTGLAGASTVMAGIGIAARGLMAALGGIPGIIAGIGGFVLSSWVFSVDKATSSLDEHQRQLQIIDATYIKVGGHIEDMKKALEGQLTASEALADAARKTKEFEEARANVEFKRRTEFIENAKNRMEAGQAPPAALQGNAVQLLVQMRELEQQFIKGGLSVEDYRKKLEEVSNSTANVKIHAVALEMEQAAVPTLALEKAMDLANAKLAVVNGTASDTQRELLGLRKSTEESSKATEESSKAWDDYEKAIDKVKETIPSLTDEMKRLKESAKIEDAFKAAFDAIGRMVGLTRLQVDGMIDSLNKLKAQQLSEASGTPMTGTFIDKVVGAESSGNPNAKAGTSSAAGLGGFIKSTWLEMFKKYFPDQASKMTDAMILELRTGREHADLVRTMIGHLATENADFLKKAGQAVTDANLYLAHFLGAKGAVKILTAAPSTPTSDILGPGQIEANRSLLANKTAGQVVAWAQKKMGVDTQDLKVQQQMTDENQKQADATDKTIQTQKFKIDQQKLINEGKEREAFINEAALKATEENKNITAETLNLIKEQAGQEFDLKNVKKTVAAAAKAATAEEKKMISDIVGLDRQRAVLMRAFILAEKQGKLGAMADSKKQIDAINAKLAELLPKAREMADKLGDQKMAANLANVTQHAAELADKLANASSATNALGLNMDQMRSIGDMFAEGLSSAVGTFFSEIQQGKSAVEALKTAFLQFASQFLIQIGQMIIKAAIFKALNSFFPGFGFGGALHGGTVGEHSIGSGNPTYRVSPAVFAGAMRFDQGGLPGLRSGEVAAILHKNEEVLKGSDPRNVLNGGKAGMGGGGGSKMDVKIVNLIDTGEFVSQGLGTAPGQRAIMNFMRGNRSAIKAALG